MGNNFNMDSESYARVQRFLAYGGEENYDDAVNDILDISEDNVAPLLVEDLRIIKNIINKNLRPKKIIEILHDES